jgi:hypothetical protein
MTFFEQPKFKQQPEPEPEDRKQDKVPPQIITIDGSNLIKEVPDNKDIPEGKIDIITMFYSVPFNYDPQTGEMK